MPPCSAELSAPEGQLPAVARALCVKTAAIVPRISLF